MLLPRPARLAKQSRFIFRRALHRPFSSIHHQTPEQPSGTEPEFHLLSTSNIHHLSQERSSHRFNDVSNSTMNVSNTAAIPNQVAGPSSIKLDDSALSENELDIDERREERRSPAAVLGSKRVGIVVVPDALNQAIQREISACDAREIRRSYMDYATGSRSSSKDLRRSNASSSTALAKAAAILPGQYAAVRNVMEEMSARLGDGWLPEGGIVEVSGTTGAGLWAVADSEGLLQLPLEGEGVTSRRYELCHASRSGIDLAGRLAGAIPGSAIQLELHRQIPRSREGKTALTLSTFHLSTLPTPSSRHSHLRQLLSLSSPYIILIDRSTPEGWKAISEAREFLLSRSTTEDPLHIVAPCPHDKPCPMLGGRDICSFSQRLQRPSVLRRTKHAKRGEEDVGYCYLVVARGERPTGELSIGGRVGGVRLEEMRKERERMEGKNELRELEGGGYEMISLASPPEPEELAIKDFEDVDIAALRKQAYGWPRLVAPPIKRSGHVIMDTCHQSGHLLRSTFAKSHGKQAYYDARKSSWGDIFPHEPKGKEIVRSRGIRKLTPAALDLDLDETPIDTKFEAQIDWPVAELQEASEDEGLEGQGNTISWKSASLRTNTSSKDGSGSKRSLHTSAIRNSVHAPPDTQTQPSSEARPRTKVTIAELYKLRSSKTPITCLTAYDYPTALLSQNAGVDMCLIGDSLSQVALGHLNTTSVTLDEMIHHAKAVTRGAKTPFIFADMPFGSFESSIEEGVKSVIRLIKEAGIDGVKIEGGREIIPLVKKLTEMGIAVMPHIGLQPQRATSLSGYLVQGRTSSSASDMFNLAKEMKEAGAFALLLEAIPHSLGSYITDNLDIITIGIGAGPGTNGQVLVITDVLGTYKGEGEWKAKFVRHFGDVANESKRAVEGFVKEVKGGGFPDKKEESYGMKKEQWTSFLEAVDASSRHEDGQR